jgi:hypothetical protein
VLKKRRNQKRKRSLHVPDRRMWAQQAPSTPLCETGRWVNVQINVNCDHDKRKEYKERENARVFIAL